MSRARTTFYSLGVGELDPENDYDDPQVRADIDRTFDLFCRNLVSARAASVAVLSVWSGYEIRMTGGLIFRKSETAKQQSAAAKSESETAGGAATSGADAAARTGRGARHEQAASARRPDRSA